MCFSIRIIQKIYYPIESTEPRRTVPKPPPLLDSPPPAPPRNQPVRFISFTFNLPLEPSGFSSVTTNIDHVSDTATIKDLKQAFIDIRRTELGELASHDHIQPSDDNFLEGIRFTGHFFESELDDNVCEFVVNNLRL